MWCMLKQRKIWIFCRQENSDVFCHNLPYTYQKGFYSTIKTNIQMLKDCKSDFKLNILNEERKVVTCLNNKNQFVIQLLSASLDRDFDMNGMTLFIDNANDNYTYDVIVWKINELVVLKADLSKNKYFIETFNFIKNERNQYELCPPGCQDCYWKSQLGIQINNKYISVTTLNCSLCKFNRYFAENYGDKCFLKKERPTGYEFVEEYRKFVSCEFCCKTQANNFKCDVCLNKEKYEYFVDEPNNGRCVKKCEGNYKYIQTDEKTCLDSCKGVPNCITFNNYINPYY